VLEQRVEDTSAAEEGTAVGMDVDVEDANGGVEPHVDVPVVHIATQSEMYGLSATTQIMGRRSFQNFHRSVEASWKEALELQLRRAADERAERETITDEELLERYEKYVRGKGDMTSGKKGRGSVGNLKNKIRR